MSSPSIEHPRVAAWEPTGTSTSISVRLQAAGEGEMAYGSGGRMKRLAACKIE